MVDVEYGESWDEAYVACDVALYEAKTREEIDWCSRRRVRG